MLVKLGSMRRENTQTQDAGAAINLPLVLKLVPKVEITYPAAAFEDRDVPKCQMLGPAETLE